MRIHPLTTLLLLLPLLGFGQGKSSVDIVGGLTYGYRHLSSDQDTMASVISFRNDIDTGRLGYRFGLNYNRKVGKRIFLRLGARFASVGHRTKKTELRWPGEHDGQGGLEPDPSLPREYHFVNEYRFLELPVAGRYEWINDNKCSFFVEAGVAPSIFLRWRTKAITNLETTTSYPDAEELGFQFNALHLVGLASVGLNYELSDRLQLFGQPTFRYHITNLRKDFPLNEQLLDAGIELGMRGKF